MANAGLKSTPRQLTPVVSSALLIWRLQKREDLSIENLSSFSLYRKLQSIGTSPFQHSSEHIPLMDNINKSAVYLCPVLSYPYHDISVISLEGLCQRLSDTFLGKKPLPHPCRAVWKKSRISSSKYCLDFTYSPSSQVTKDFL